MSTAPSTYVIEARTSLTEAETIPLRALVERVTDHDGANPLSEHVWLHLAGGGDDHGRHLIALTPGGQMVGYAHLDVTDLVDGPSAELAVDPAERRNGLGRQLIASLITQVPDAPLRLWAHGEHAGSAELATIMGFQRARVLWQMQRSLVDPLPQPVLPPDVAVRPFRVGVDEAEWLALNAAAFAELPDQGRWTIDDLELRLREPWFSAEGFLTAWRDGRMVGFHWTKVHGAEGQHHHEPIGEVYVIGIDPRLRGEGLGRALTVVGLSYLRSLGLNRAMLYVDATNTGAIALYESLGFTRSDTDVLFRRTP